jgi:GNAT superfamily N-acetyltransferase
MTADRPDDRLVGVADADDSAFGAARGIYEAGIPAAVRAPFHELVDARPDERMQLLLDGPGQVVGVALVRDLGQTRWTFLRYFVVTAHQRGQGIGSRLWSALCRDLGARGRERLLFDVEDPDDAAADPHEVDERQRRVRFYRRLGADLVELADPASYAPPHHGEAGTTAIPLRLLGADLDGAGGSRPLSLDGPATEALVAAVLLLRYGVEPPDGSSQEPHDLPAS